MQTIICAVIVVLVIVLGMWLLGTAEGARAAAQLTHNLPFAHCAPNCVFP